MALLDFLRSAGRTRPPPTRAPIDPGLEHAGAIDQNTYPSVDPGIAAATVDAMVRAHDELLTRFKYCYGSDRATFERDVLAPIRNYAAYVNLIPATADNFFCGPGGLFRLGLEVAFYALQGTDGHIVAGRATISVRRELEPRWRHATFLAALCAELHRTLSHVVVTDEQGDEWPSFLVPLTTWLRQRRAERFYLRWIANAPESRGLGLFALPHIAPPETLQHLATGNSSVVPQLLASITGMPLYHEQSILSDLVKRSAALVIDRDLVASAHRYGRPILGAHLERYLLDAMRRLVTSHPAWSPNSERSRVWLSADGLFIVWPNAVNEIRKILEEDELPGIPKAPETIVEILSSAGVLQTPPNGQSLWSIAPDPDGQPLQAVRLTSPDILLAAHARPIAPLPRAIVVAPGGGTARTSTHARVSRPEVAAPVPPAQNPAEAAAAPAQAELALMPAATATGPEESVVAVSPASEPTPAAPAAPPPVRFRLAAPLRLLPQVRQALSVAVESMNGDAKSANAITVPAGVFVPLAWFKRQQVDLAVTLRSLVDVGMLVGTQGQRARTFQHEVHGAEQAGVVIKPRFVIGLDTTDFLPSD